MSDEEIIKQRFGKEQPFTVPEGFFDNFATQLMQQLPERDIQIVPMKKSIWERVRPYAVAASVALLIGGAGTMFLSRNTIPEETKTAEVQNTKASNEYSIDQMADYAMLDNQDFYCLLSDNL